MPLRRRRLRQQRQRQQRQQRLSANGRTPTQSCGELADQGVVRVLLGVGGGVRQWVGEGGVGAEPAALSPCYTLATQLWPAARPPAWLLMAPTCTHARPCRRQWEALLAEAAACGSDQARQQELAGQIEQQMPGVAEGAWPCRCGLLYSAGPVERFASLKPAIAVYGLILSSLRWQGHHLHTFACAGEGVVQSSSRPQSCGCVRCCKVCHSNTIRLACVAVICTHLHTCIPLSPPAAGVSVKYGKKLLGKLQRAPAAAAALAAAAAAAAEVLAPGFDEAMAAAEAAERRANPAAALPDDLFSDEPLPAARQPCAAERRAAEVEAELEAALAEARSLRAFLREAELEAAEAALAALQQRRQAREAQQAAAAAAAAMAAAAAHQQAPPLGLAVGNGHLSQLPLLSSPAPLLGPAAGGPLGLARAAALAAAEGATAHDGLSPENECVICLADVRCVVLPGFDPYICQL